MSVKQRGKGWQTYVASNGRSYRQICPTKEDAAILEAQWRQTLAKGETPQRARFDKRTGIQLSGISIGEALDKAYSEYWKGSKNEQVVFYHVQIINKK